MLMHLSLSLRLCKCAKDNTSSHTRAAVVKPARQGAVASPVVVGNSRGRQAGTRIRISVGIRVGFRVRVRLGAKVWHCGLVVFGLVATAG